MRTHQFVIEGDDTPLLVQGDELRLEQVVHNLIGNAVKYSPAGGLVRLTLQQRGEQVSLAVTDHGMGISAAALPHLFDRFYRAPNAADHAISGLGIGLYVVHEIVVLHGGTVTVTSEEGVGSTFTVVLPAA
jgi:signal transduction histidine kinase